MLVQSMPDGMLFTVRHRCVTILMHTQMYCEVLKCLSCVLNQHGVMIAEYSTIYFPLICSLRLI